MNYNSVFQLIGIDENNDFKFKKIPNLNKNIETSLEHKIMILDKIITQNNCLDIACWYCPLGISDSCNQQEKTSTQAQREKERMLKCE